MLCQIVQEPYGMPLLVCGSPSKCFFNMRVSGLICSIRIKFDGLLLIFEGIVNSRDVFGWTILGDLDSGLNSRQGYIIGILLGKYLTVVYFTSELFSDASVMNLVFDGEMVSAFVETFTDYFSEPVDLLFIVLAIVSAWQIPGRMAKTSLASDASSSDHAPRA